jgi:hypothetical protein
MEYVGSMCAVKKTNGIGLQATRASMIPAVTLAKHSQPQELLASDEA